MEHVSQCLVDAAADIIGAQEYVDDHAKQRIAELVSQQTTIDRLLNIIPEAFGIALISHLPAACTVVLPNTFFVKDRIGDWVELSMDREPIFHAAIIKAQRTFHNGPRLIFQNNSNRSALLSAVSNALDSNASLDGAELAGPAFAELPASLYGV
jgi:hypothetical protein